jgi:glycosyltransferase involved in cell wall biosynthesis
MSAQPHSPRIAYFPDSFHEVNGVAHTSRNFVAFARRHSVPMLCVRAGQKTQIFPLDGSVQALELGRSRFAVQMEKDLSFDPLFFRYSGLISSAVRAFHPDIIHITGPSELGIFGAYFAWKLKIPLAASWHTNMHEYAARRMLWLSRHLGSAGSKLEHSVEAGVLNATSRFYRLAKVVYAPNPELCALLERTTYRPCHLMQRGVETETFTPAKRTRPPNDSQLIREPVLGYVGRLSVEKNVALLPTIDAHLRVKGITPKWLIVGHGAEDKLLRRELPTAELAGVLRGEALAQAYANMDLLVFPSHTDTFGNVVLEALASGVPAIVTPDGGPAHIISSGTTPEVSTGHIARDEDFAAAITDILSHPDTFAAMRLAARQYALRCSWDTVFARVIAAYPAPAL